MQQKLNDIVPKYLQVYEYLQSMIRRNKIGFGDKLPTEMALAERFSLNRMTVRKALDKLAVEKMVVRKRGQGTFLISKAPKEFTYNLDIISSYFKDIRSYGIHPSSKTLTVEVMDGDGRISAFLELEKDTRVIFMRRVFYANDEPIMIEKNYMPYSEFKDLLTMDLSGLRYPLLKEKYNVVPHRANQTLKAILSDEDAMKIFGFSKQQACVELELVVYDASNVPIEVGYYLYRGDRYKFNINSIKYLND